MKTTARYLFTGASAGICFAIFATLYSLGVVIRLVEITYRMVPR